MFFHKPQLRSVRVRRAHAQSGLVSGLYGKGWIQLSFSLSVIADRNKKSLLVTKVTNICAYEFNLISQCISAILYYRV